MKLVPIGMIVALASAACLTARSGPVSQAPDAPIVRLVHDSSQVRDCVPVRSVQVSDGIARREQNRVQEGDQERAYERLKKITAQEGGDTALIKRESYDLNLEPPAFVWTLDAAIFQCALERGEVGQ